MVSQGILYGQIKTLYPLYTYIRSSRGDIPFDLVGIVSGILIAWVVGMAIRALGHDGKHLEFDNE